MISGHAVLAVTGLAAWAGYLITGADGLAWTAALLLAVVAGLGITLAVRWIGVYREAARPALAVRPGGRAEPGWAAAPPERNFPVPVVVAHGAFALVTIVLVVLATLEGNDP